MELLCFKDWLAQHETTAFTRARMAASKGLGPMLPRAAWDSHDTAPPQVRKGLEAHSKHHPKKKREPVVHHDVDTWLDSVDKLKKDLEVLKVAIAGKDKAPTQRTKEVTPKEPERKGSPFKMDRPDKEPERKDSPFKKDDRPEKPPFVKKKEEVPPKPDDKDWPPKDKAEERPEKDAPERKSNPFKMDRPQKPPVNKPEADEEEE